MSGRVAEFFHDFRGFKPDAKKLVVVTVLTSVVDDEP